jgi:hypothetical protein
MYYFVRKEKNGEETEPKLPKNTGFLLLAEAGNGSKYSLYECDLTKKHKK